jgi:hypothetical protein
MIFCGVETHIASLHHWVYGRTIQTRGIYGLRREGENTKTAESKAAATGAKNALIEGLFELCCFILLIAFVIF